MPTITLLGQGGSLVCELGAAADDQQFVTCTMQIVMDERVGVIFPRAEETWMRLRDIDRLVSYIRNHIGPDTQHAIELSDVFVPLELGFELQCLAGEQECWADGYFVMTWMLFAGSPDRALDVNVGCSPPVLVSDALAWCESLERVRRDITVAQ